MNDSSLGKEETRDSGVRSITWKTGERHNILEVKYVRGTQSCVPKLRQQDIDFNVPKFPLPIIDFEERSKETGVVQCKADEMMVINSVANDYSSLSLIAENYDDADDMMENDAVSPVGADISMNSLVPNGDELTNDADDDVEGDVDDDDGDVATPAEINGALFNNEYDDEEDSRTNDAELLNNNNDDDNGDVGVAPAPSFEAAEPSTSTQLEFQTCISDSIPENSHEYSTTEPNLHPTLTSKVVDKCHVKFAQDSEAFYFTSVNDGEARTIEPTNRTPAVVSGGSGKAGIDVGDKGSLGKGKGKGKGKSSATSSASSSTWKSQDSSSDRSSSSFSLSKKIPFLHPKKIRSSASAPSTSNTMMDDVDDNLSKSASTVTKSVDDHSSSNSKKDFKAPIKRKEKAQWKNKGEAAKKRAKERAKEIERKKAGAKVKAESKSKEKTKEKGKQDSTKTEKKQKAKYDLKLEQGKVERAKVKVKEGKNAKVESKEKGKTKIKADEDGLQIDKNKKKKFDWKLEQGLVEESPGGCRYSVGDVFCPYVTPSGVKCPLYYKRRCQMLRHYENKHLGRVWVCCFCGHPSNCSADLKKHINAKHWA